MDKNKQTEFPDMSSATCEAPPVSPDELSAYIDKELPTWKRHLIRRHLKKCATCAAHVQGLQQLDVFLRHSGEVEAPDDFLTNVMGRASKTTKYERPYNSVWDPGTRIIGSALQKWVRHSSTLANRLRDSIRTRSPVYIFVLTFAVFTMVGATLYQSPSDRFGPSPHGPKKTQKLDGEKLISFEVIQHQPPKRLLTTYLQQK